jgi:hypothetical protein
MVFRDNDVSDVRAGRWVIRYSARCVWPIDQTGILIGLFAYETASWHDRPGFPVHVVGIQFIRHEDGKTATKEGRQVRSNWAMTVMVKQPGFSPFTGKSFLDGSSLQVL